MKKNNKFLVTVVMILGLLLVTLGVSYSFFSYVREGSEENSIKLGSITFKYTEVSGIGNGITIQDAFPMSDEEGKIQVGVGNVFDFKVESTLSRSDLEYEVVAQPTQESTVPLDAIKFYLTDITSGTEKAVNTTLDNNGEVKTLDQYSDTLIKNTSGKTIYQETILRNTKGYLKEFRARMWISENIDWTDEKYMGTSSTIRINVYANSNRDIASTDTVTTYDTSIERATANNTYLFKKAENENEQYHYSLTVPNEVDTLNVDVFPTSMDATVEIELLEDGYAYNHDFSNNLVRLSNLTRVNTSSLIAEKIKEYDLPVGDTFFKATVTSSDKTKTQEYILKVTREESSNTGLASLEVVGYDLVPSYSDSINSYIVNVSYDTTNVEITATKKEETQEITGTGNYKVENGTNAFIVTVKAQNGTTRTIQITVNRKLSDDASINNVAVNGYTLTHLESNIYTVTVPNEVTSVEIINVSTTGATVTGIGKKENLIVGNNNYEVEVTSQSEEVTNKYIIRVIREQDDNTALKSLAITDQTITPNFNKDVLLYNATVTNSTTSIEVTAEAESSVAKVTIEKPESLIIGENEIRVKVTAQNGETRTYIITVTRQASSDATLKSLSVKNYEINPEFKSGTTEYTLSVPYNTTSIEVSATANHSAASVGISGNSNLEVGENIVTVKVTAQDKTTKDYTITVTREKDNDNTLKSLSLTNCTLSPSFVSNTTEYTCTVANNITSTEVTAEANSAHATVSITGNENLAVGKNEVNIAVTSQIGTVKTYKVTVTRQANSDATLKSLSIDGYTIAPDFESSITSYTVSVPYGVTKVIVNAEVNNSEASLVLSGNTDLEVGDNDVTVKVTAQDGTTKTYTIKVTREKDTTNTLSDLSLSNCTLSPSFASATTSYTCTVENSVTEVAVAATPTSSLATVTGTGTKELTVGENTINVVVKSQSGLEKTYTVTVTRKKSSDATLKDLVVEGYTISPNFASATTSYKVTVPYSVTSVIVTATVNNSEATAIVSGNNNFQIGENTVIVKVTAEDGTTKDYTIVVTRSQDTDNTLKSLSLTNCTLSPSFASNTTEYTCTVTNNITSTEVTAEATSEKATVSVTKDETLKVGQNEVNITVTAQSGAVKTYQVIVTRQASSDATLKSLNVTGYTISPDFASATTEYTLSVPYDVTKIIVNATVNNSEASSKVSGNTDLKLGENTVIITVTAGDGTTKDYKIVVTREKDTDATLSKLSLTDCTLTPSFASNTTEYTCTVANSVTSTEVTAESTSSLATISGTGSKDLSVGQNTITVKVTAQDGTTSKTYTVIVTRKASSDAALSSLELWNWVSDIETETYTLSPSFASGITSYKTIVPYNVTALLVTADARNSEAKVSISGNTGLIVGDNTVKVAVTAGDGTTKDYTITVTRSKDTDNTLKSLNLTSCTLSPGFTSDTTEYTCTVANSITSTTVSAEATSSVATISGTGSKELSVGENTVTITVTSQSGTVKTYKVTVIRQANSDATLKSLSVTGYKISPDFASGTTSYTLTVPYSVTSVTVNAEANNSEATVTGTGNKALNVGTNTATIIVTAEDKTKKEYTITITRSKDTTATLSKLSLTDCTLSPTFASGTTSYSCTVANSVTSTTVSAEATSNVATISGTGSKALSVGANTVTVKVTAQDGTTSETYTVIVTREANSDATLKSLGVTGQTLSPDFASGTTSYTLTVPYSIDNITITAAPTASTSTIIGTGSKTLDVGENTFEVKVTAEDKTTTETYTIVVTRSKDTDTSLKSISVTGYDIVKVDNNHYTLTVDNDVISVEVNAEATSSVAIVTGTGDKELNIGSNIAKVTVTAQSGAVSVYEIEITRLASSDATLKSLSVTGYTISPDFGSETTAYTLTVPYNVTSVEVNATVNNSDASLTGTGSKSLSVGSNPITVTVTAGDGTKKEYTITITRSQDTVNTLSALSLTNCTLSPGFASGTTSYSCTVANSITSTTVSATPTSSVASVSGTGSKSLTVGSNTITVRVTAQNGTPRDYTITVKRKGVDTVTLNAKSTTYTGSAITANTASATSGSDITYTYYNGTSCSGTALSGAPTDVGNYSVKAASAGNNDYESGSTCVTHTITQGTPIISLIAKSETYTGSAIPANTATATNPNGTSVTLSYTYKYYSDSSCTTALSSTPVNAGTYYVKATSAATTNLVSASSSCTKHTINKKTDTVSLTAKSKTYTGSAIEANTASATSGSDITYTYYNGTSCSGTALSGAPTNVGNYSVKATSVGNSNYSSGSKCVTHTITQGTPTITLSDKSATYTGSAIAANNATAQNPNGTSVTLTYVYNYYSDSSCTKTITPATATTVAVPVNAGTYYAQATSTATSNLKSASSNCAKHTITKKTDTVTLSAKSTAYTGSAIESNTASATSGSSITYAYYNGTSCSGTAISTPINVGNYSVKATSAGNNNYSSGSTCVTHTITQAVDSITLSAKNTTYTGSAITANTASATSGSNITYTYYNGTSCSGTALSGAPTSVGNYSVKAVSAGNSNYSSGSKCVTHTITQGTPTISLTAKTATYNGSAIAANTATAKNPNGTSVTLSYTYTYYTNDSCSTGATTTAPTTAGTYYVKATSTATTNLVSASSSCTKHTINKKVDSITLTAKNTTYTGGGISANTASATSGSGITYTYYNGTSCSGTALSGAPTNVGNYSVKATSAGNTNYSSASKCVTHTITQGTPTINLTAKTATYTGSAISANTATATNPNGSSVTLTYTYNYYSDSSCSTSLTPATATTVVVPVNPGTYYVKATSTATTNLKSASSSCTKHTINKKADTITLSAKSTAYTGSAIAANTASATSGTKITYTYYSTTDCTGTALSSAPSAVGNYSVKATSAGNAFYSSGSKCVTHTITKKADNVSLTAKSTTYTGSAITANTASSTSGTSITYTYYSTTDCTGTALSSAPSAVGNYSVKATSAGNSNYSSGSKCVTHTITQGTPTLSSTAVNTTYTGSAITANKPTAKNPNGTSVTLTYSYTYYSTTNCTGTALSSAPTNVGNYSVKATSTATTNLKSASKCVTHTITKGTPTLSLTAKSTTYTGSAISANTATAKNPNGGAVTLSYTYTYYSTTNCTGTALSSAPTNVGNYSVKATSTATTNLNSASKCATHTITKGTPTISLTAKSAQATGSAITANTATAKNPNGTSVTLSYTYKYYSNSSCSTALSSAPSAVGTYYVKATSNATDNLNSASSSCTKHTITANTNANLSDLSVSGYSISPAFNASTLEYTVTVEASSVTINATKASSLATISGNGTKKLGWGTATANVIVTAQSGDVKTYKITITNTKPTAPTITGGSSSWVSTAPTIKLSKAGSAVSNVNTYEYYKSTSSTAPTNASLSNGTESVGTTATGTTSGNLTVSDEGTTYVWYRTVSKNGFRSNWTSSQTVKLDTTTPTVSLTGIPSTITQGDSYAIPTSTSFGKSGKKSVSCLINNTAVTNTNTLTAGSYSLSCTATSNAGKSGTASKTITVKAKVAVNDYITVTSAENTSTSGWVDLSLSQTAISGGSFAISGGDLKNTSGKTLTVSVSANISYCRNGSYGYDNLKFGDTYLNHSGEHVSGFCEYNVTKTYTATMASGATWNAQLYAADTECCGSAWAKINSATITVTAIN